MQSNKLCWQLFYVPDPKIHSSRWKCIVLMLAWLAQIQFCTVALQHPEQLYVRPLDGHQYLFAGPAVDRHTSETRVITLEIGYPRQQSCQYCKSLFKGLSEYCFLHILVILESQRRYFIISHFIFFFLYSVQVPSLTVGFLRYK